MRETLGMLTSCGEFLQTLASLRMESVSKMKLKPRMQGSGSVSRDANVPITICRYSDIWCTRLLSENCSVCMPDCICCYTWCECHYYWYQRFHHQRETIMKYDHRLWLVWVTFWHRLGNYINQSYHMTPRQQNVWTRIPEPRCRCSEI